MKKKKIEKISLICAFSALVVTLGAIPLGSYLGYNAYVDKINNNKTSISSKPTEEKPTDPVLIKIEARLKPGLGYYNNGKANPIKNDFEVVGIYSIGKDNTIEETLSSKQYEMIVPDDFALNGGTIVFKHEEFSFDFVVQLEAVKPAKLEFTSSPYIVCYKEGEKFSKDGIKGNVVYNDGSKKAFNEKFLIIDNKNALKTTDKKMKLSYKVDGEIVSGEIDLNVVNESQYDNGDLIRLVSTGDTFIEDGNALSSAELEVRAEYESNNKLMINSSDVVISNDTNIAKFGTEEILNVACKNDSNAELKVEAYVAKTIDLSSISTLKNGKSYLFDGSDFISEMPTSYIGDFKKDDTISFDVNTTNICTSSLIMDIANYDFNKVNEEYSIKDLLLNDVISIFVNNKAVEYDDTYLSGYGNFTDLDKAGNVYDEINIQKIKLKKGNNNIKLHFKEDSKLKINNIKLASKGVKEKYKLGEYVIKCEEDNIAPSYMISKYDKINDFSSKAGKLMQGACLIDDDVYYLMASGGSLKGAVVRYNLSTGERISESNAFSLASKSDWSYQNAGNMAYINGLLYITKVDGSLLTVNPYTMEVNENCTNPFNGFDQSDRILALEANKYLHEYVLFVRKANNKCEMQFYDRKLNKIENKVVAFSDLNGSAFQNSYSNDKYIYALYSKDGGHQFDIALYDWDGNKIKEFSLVGGKDELGTGEVGGKDRLQNIIEYNGELYVGCMLWEASTNVIYKVQYDTSSFVSYESLSLGEYLSKCKENNLEAKYTISNPSIMSRHLVNGSCLTQDIVSDGKYAYIGVTTFDGSKSGYVEKYDLSTDKSILISEKITCSTNSSWSLQTGGNICYANGKILFITNGLGIVTLDAETLKIERTTVDFSASNDNSAFTGISYNQVTNRYVVSYESNNSYIFDDSCKLVAKLEKNTTHSSLLYQTTTSNSNYIYQTFGKDGTYASTINVFDWNGNFITSLNIDTKDSAIKLGDSASGSVQGVFEYNERIYLLILQWGDNKGGFLYQLNMDQTIFPE